MTSALIGCSGFVGSNLRLQRKWDFLYNRGNAHLLSGRYGTVVCAAAPGVKWIANRDPDADWASIHMLLNNGVCRIQSAERFVLISTADVFGPLQHAVGPDETTAPEPQCHYGNNRRMLELLILQLFPRAQIVRLPGLIGPDLKKGPIFDLRNEHRLEFLNPDSIYQWYSIENLWADIKDRTEPIIHLCSPPERLGNTVERDFPLLDKRLTGIGIPARYNLRTTYQSPCPIL